MRANIDEVKHLYYNEKLTQREVAKRMEVRQGTVSKIMQEFRLKPRDPVEMQMLRWKNGVYDALRKQVAFNCDLCHEEATMPLSQWRRSQHHYCSEKCRLKALKEARGRATIIGKETEDRWLSEQENQETLFRSAELPDFMKVTEDGVEFYEIKTRRWRLRPNQKSVIARLRELGFKVEVVVLN